MTTPYVLHDSTGLIIVVGLARDNEHAHQQLELHEGMFNRPLWCVTDVSARPKQYIHLDEEGSPIITDEPPDP